MKKIKLDSGLESVQIGEGVLRFNPRDPNLYVRFAEAEEKLRALEADLAEQGKQAEGDGNRLVRILQEADSRMKQILNWIFGEGNDFHQILGGVNLLAVATNGQRVVTNLFAALEPLITAGAKQCARDQTVAAVAQAERRRAGQG